MDDKGEKYPDPERHPLKKQTKKTFRVTMDQ